MMFRAVELGRGRLAVVAFALGFALRVRVHVQGLCSRFVIRLDVA